MTIQIPAAMRAVIHSEHSLGLPRVKTKPDTSTEVHTSGRWAGFTVQRSTEVPVVPEPIAFDQGGYPVEIDGKALVDEIARAFARDLGDNLTAGSLVVGDPIPKYLKVNYDEKHDKDDAGVYGAIAATYAMGRTPTGRLVESNPPIQRVPGGCSKVVVQKGRQVSLSAFIENHLNKEVSLSGNLQETQEWSAGYLDSIQSTPRSPNLPILIFSAAIIPGREVKVGDVFYGDAVFRKDAGLAISRYRWYRAEAVNDHSVRAVEAEDPYPPQCHLYERDINLGVPLGSHALGTYVLIGEQYSLYLSTGGREGPMLHSIPGRGFRLISSKPSAIFTKGHPLHEAQRRAILKGLLTLNP